MDIGEEKDNSQPEDIDSVQAPNKLEEVNQYVSKSNCDNVINLKQQHYPVCVSEEVILEETGFEKVKQKYFKASKEGIIKSNCRIHQKEEIFSFNRYNSLKSKKAI